MNFNPEDAEFFFSNMGGYVKEYEATTETQKYGVPLAFTNGAMSANATVNYKKIKHAEFTGSTSSNADFRYTTKGAAKLATSLNLGVEQQFEVPSVIYLEWLIINRCSHLVKTTFCHSIK